MNVRLHAGNINKSITIKELFMNCKFLQIKWSISRGRDTYGYNICTLKDSFSKPMFFRCNGGGYDMQGTVLSNWLITNYYHRLNTLHAHLKVGDSENRSGVNYGLFLSQEGKRIYLDGACGLSSMINIAKKIGIEIKQEYGSRGKTMIGFLVVDHGHTM